MQNRAVKISKYKMINFDDVADENKTEHNSNWQYILDHQYSILIIRGSGSGKTNGFWNLINNWPDIDEIYLYAKYPYKAKYQYSIKKTWKRHSGHWGINPPLKTPTPSFLPSPP